MYLYVLRHGKAGDGYPDEIRELTERGRDNLDVVLSGCAKDIKPLAQIQRSPLVRAQQTAEIAARILGFDQTISENEQATPWGSPQKFLDSLDEQFESVLVASHQPFVSFLVEHLTGEDIPMRTSALVAIKVNYPGEGGGDLLWHRDPNTKNTN